MILGTLIEKFFSFSRFHLSAILRSILSNDRAAKASLRLRAVPTVTSLGEILWNRKSHCVLMRGGVAASFRSRARSDFSPRELLPPSPRRSRSLFV